MFIPFLFLCTYSRPVVVSRCMPAGLGCDRREFRERREGIPAKYPYMLLRMIHHPAPVVPSPHNVVHCCANNAVTQVLSTTAENPCFIQPLTPAHPARALSRFKHRFLRTGPGWGLIHSPHGHAIKERRPLAESTPLSARSSGGIIKLFRWPLFGSGPSASAAPSPPLEI